MKPVLSISVVILGVVAGWVGVASHLAQAATDPYPFQKIVHDPFDPAQKDREIAFHEGRVRRDPAGAIGWAMLSGAYVDRSRESDSYSDAVKGENAARTSLKLRTKGNLGAQTRLIGSLLQQHRFLDALAVDEKALKIWDPEESLTQLHMDILIELGRYEQAAKVEEAHPEAFASPVGKSVVAHYDAITGRPLEALQLLRAAYDEVDKSAGATAENMAWFEEKMGESLVMMGRSDEAQIAFKKTLELYPRSYKAYANLCRLAIGRGDWKAAIECGDRSNAIAPMPDILAMVGDAYAQLGNRQAAESQYLKVVALAGKPSGPANGLHEFAGATGGHGHTLDRQYAMFCADHSRDLDGGYACALRELQVRRDVFAFDTFAWICLKRGEIDEARRAIDLALSHGTRDARMLYHAGRIYAAANRPQEAASFLNQALDLDPDFDALEAQDARSLLDAGANHR